MLGFHAFSSQDQGRVHYTRIRPTRDDQAHQEHTSGGWGLHPGGIVQHMDARGKSQRPMNRDRLSAILMPTITSLLPFSNQAARLCVPAVQKWYLSTFKGLIREKELNKGAGLYPHPRTLSPQPSALSPQPPTLNIHPSSVNRQPVNSWPKRQAKRAKQ